MQPGLRAPRCRPAILLLALFVGGCSVLPPWRSFFGGTCDMSVRVAPGINQNSPVPVEILLVYDAALLKKVSAMSAQEWFAGRQQFLRDNPPGKGYGDWFWEWIPGQAVADQSLPYHPLIKGGVIFAGYFSPGDHRFQFLPFGDLSIELQATDFTATGP
jgi:type VI secretion system protein